MIQTLLHRFMHWLLEVKGYSGLLLRNRKIWSRADKYNFTLLLSRNSKIHVAR